MDYEELAKRYIRFPIEHEEVPHPREVFAVRMMSGGMRMKATQTICYSGRDTTTRKPMNFVTDILESPDSHPHELMIPPI